MMLSSGHLTKIGIMLEPNFCGKKWLKNEIFTNNLTNDSTVQDVNHSRQKKI
jgi:hypothetical protein